MEPLQAFGSIVHLDSFNAALSSVVQGDGSAAVIRVASPAPQPSQHTQQRASFTQPEHAAVLLGLALFGPRWTDVAGIVAGREVRAPERGRDNGLLHHCAALPGPRGQQLCN